MVDVAGTINSLFELVQNVKKIEEHISSFRSNKEQAAALFYGKIENAGKSLKSLHHLYSSVDGTLDKHMCLIWENAISNISAGIGQITKNADALQTLLNTDPPQSSKFGKLWKVRKGMRNFMKASEVNNQIANWEKSIDALCSQVESLAKGMYSLRLQSSQVQSTTKNEERFKPSFNSAPQLPADAILNFGDPETMEAQLRDCIVQSAGESDYGVTAATGVAGMGGIGKTTALMGLARNDQLRSLFSDGIYFMRLGKDADMNIMIEQLSEIVFISGGVKQSKAILEIGDLIKAINMSVSWFKDRKVLFMVDDIWGTSTSPVGFLPDIKRLLEASRHCRMVVSTRSQAVALEAGMSVTFGPRDVTGPEAHAILIKYANISQEMLSSATSETNSAIEDILIMCGGIPLTLGVAGRAIRFLTRPKKRWQGAVLAYNKSQKNRLSVSHKPLGNYPSFSFAVTTSLELADNWWNISRGGRLESDVASCSSLFRRLSVLPRQAQVRSSLIAKIWHTVAPGDVEDLLEKLTDLNLVLFADLETDEYSSEQKYGLHDLILDYCRRQEEDRTFYYQCHCDLLNQFRLSSAGGVPSQAYLNGTASEFWDFDIVTNSSFSWWNVRDDDKDYLCSNISRHIVGANRLAELVALLTSGEWTKLRLSTGGLIAFMADFDILFESVGNNRSPPAESREQAKRDLTIIRNAARLFWAYVSQNQSELATQVFSRLLNIPESGALIARYVQSVGQLAPRPWMRPKQRCNPVPTDEVEYSLPLPSLTWGCAVNYKRDMAVIAGGSCVVWVDLKKWTTAVSEHQEKETVTSIACSFDTKVVVTGSNFGKVQVWDSKTRKCVRTFSGCSSTLFSMCMSPNDQVVAAGAADGKVRLWDVESGIMCGEPLDGHTGQVRAICFSDDGTKLASASYDSTIQLWNVHDRSVSGTPMRSEGERISAVKFAPCGKRVLSGGADCRIRMWDVEGREVIWISDREHCGEIRALSFSADGRLVMSGSTDKSTRVWNADTGQVWGKALKGHEGTIVAAVFGAKHRQVLTASEDNTMRLWNLSGNEQSDKCQWGHDVRVWHTATSADGQLVASACGDGTIRMWDVMRECASEHVLTVHDGQVRRVAFSADGSMMVFGTGGGEVGVVEVAHGSMVMAKKRAHEAAVWSVAFEGGGRRVATASTHIRVWDVQSGDAIGASSETHSDEVRSMVFMRGGDWLASGSMDGSVALWDFERRSSRLFCAYGGSLGGVYSIACTTDERFIVAGYEKGAFVVWDVECGTMVGGAVAAHDRVIRSVAVSENCSTIGTTGYDSRLTVWKWAGAPFAATGRLVLVAKVTLPSYAESVGIARDDDGDDFVVVGTHGGLGLRFDIVA